MYCACLHHLLVHESSRLKVPNGTLGTPRSSSRDDGVSTSGSLLSLLTGVNGRSFMMRSTSAITVRRPSSVSSCCPISERRMLLIDLIRRSHSPPRWLEWGGLKLHSILFEMSPVRIVVWSSYRSLTASRSSFSAAVKLVPRSLNIRRGNPRRAVKRDIALRNDSAERKWTISRWTALVVMHVKMQPYLFTELLFCLTRNGPNKSTPVYVKGGSPAVTCSFRTGAICCSHSGVFNRLQ